MTNRHIGSSFDDFPHRLLIIEKGYSLRIDVKRKIIPAHSYDMWEMTERV